MNNNPSIKDVTALEVYIISWLGFVFFAMIEFSVVLLTPAVDEKSTKERNDKGNERKFRLETSRVRASHKESNQDNSNNNGISGNQLFRPMINQKRMDYISGLIFATSFVLFNMIYWIYFLIRFSPNKNWRKWCRILTHTKSYELQILAGYPFYDIFCQVEFWLIKNVF